MTKYIIPICVSMLAGALLSYAQQLHQDQQNADIATAQRDEEAQPVSEDDPNLIGKFDNDDIDEVTHVRDFDAEALGIVDSLCKNSAKSERPYTCVRSGDSKTINVTFVPNEGDVEEQTFEYSADCIARQLRQGAEHPNEVEEFYVYHDQNGQEISEEEYERLAELEMKHEREGTLHLLYPDIYDENYREWYDRLAEDTEEDSEESEAEADDELAGSSFWKPGAERIPAVRPKSSAEGEGAARDAAHEAL